MLVSASVVASFVGLAISAPTPPEVVQDSIESRAVFPFTKVIAFGDDFTDNSQGSYAHNITGNPDGSGKKLWGAGTWTDGPVAVTYLAESLGMNLAYDYAFGSAQGGGVIGSICNNSVIPTANYPSHAKLEPGKLVPDALSQIKNYTSHARYSKNMGSTLHFLWTANNDMIASLGYGARFTICDKDTLCHPGQQVFIKQLLGCMSGALTHLINKGGKHILVPNVYPRNLAPWTSQYVSTEAGMIADFGQVISSYNTQLAALIASLNKQYGSNIMYYDANAFLQKALKTPSMVEGAAYTNTCVDGCPTQVSTKTSNFNMWYQNTLIGKQPDQFYWMTSVVVSTTVMKALAADMFTFLKLQF